MRRIWAVLALSCAVACDGSSSDGEPAADGGTKHRPGSADAGVPAACHEPDAGVSQFSGVASASLSKEKLHFSPELTLSGPNLDGVLDAKQNGALLMSWQRERLLALAWGGFWDLEPGAVPQWVETSRMMHGVLTGDFDGDGDLDAVMASTGPQMNDPTTGAPPGPPVAQAHVWERTETGLVQRDQLDIAGLLPFVTFPFASMDIDRDGHLDIVCFWQNELIGFFGDGALGFRREHLETGDESVAAWGPLMLRVEDRNADEIPDLVIVMGRGGSNFTFRTLVFLRDASGKFMHSAPPGEFDSTPAPIDCGDVTGDGLSDVVAQGFPEAVPTLRLTVSEDATTFAPTKSIEPPSVGLKLGDVDGDGTLDVLTKIDDQLVAQLARDGEFERRDLGLKLSANLIDFAVRPGKGRRSPSLLVLYSVSCNPSCDEGCLDRCFEDGCVVCSKSTDCESGYCEAGSCATRPPGSL